MKHTTVPDQRLQEILAAQRAAKKAAAVKAMHRVHNVAVVAKIDPKEKA